MKDDFLIDSSGYVLKLLQKILDTNIEIQGIHNIPENNPRIFVANHFTRMEALVVPYWLYNTTGKKVGVIADDSIFISYFGDFLKKIGALSKTHPNRDNIIMGDILRGNKDWLIFPEGMMVKGKRIIKEENKHYSVKVDGVTKKVFTGAAYFGLNSQLLREDYLNNQIDNPEQFKQQYFLENLEDITSHETMMVPVNISYCPIRTGNNFLLEIAKKLIDNLNDRLLEELEIEGNIILNSKIIIQILEPVSLKSITNNVHIVHSNPIASKVSNQHLNHNDIINQYRRGLTNDFMKKIYENTTIRFDHIFVLVLYFTTYDLINKEYFKRLIFLIAKEIKKSQLFFDHDIDINLLHLISYESFEPFENALKVAITDRIMNQTEENYIINKENLLKGYTHHTIRLKNIFKVVLNEILIIEDVVELTQYHMEMSPQEINRKISQFLKQEEKEEFENDRQHHLNNPDLKPKEIGQAYHLKHKQNSKTVVILIHGFCASPMEVKELSHHLYQSHFDIHAIRLKGHGTCAQDLRDTTWKDWYNSLNRAISIASMSYENIYVAGFSAGGLLALLSSQKNYAQLKGVICINAALELNDIRVKTLVPAVNLWNDIISSMNMEALQKEYVHNTAQFPKINYDKHYVKSIFQLKRLMETTHKMLSTITTPIIILQADRDPVVNPSSAQTIYDNIASTDKTLQYFEDDRHIIIKGEKTQPVFDTIADFILSHTS